MTRALIILAAAGLTAGAALAASSIKADHKFGWAENIGWTNWRDANGANAGVRIHPNHLSGWIWSENVGWISVGQGPDDCQQYSNSVGGDAGVNILAGGDLAGLAWGENIGWINFDTRASLLGLNMQARFDYATRRFRGFAWGENVGWINLDDTVQFIAANATCLGDVNQDGFVDFMDLNFVLSSFNSGGACTLGDTNGDGVTDFQDLNNVVSFFNTSCPQ